VLLGLFILFSGVSGYSGASLSDRKGGSRIKEEMTGISDKAASDTNSGLRVDSKISDVPVEDAVAVKAGTSGAKSESSPESEPKSSGATSDGSDPQGPDIGDIPKRYQDNKYNY
jgi:hypothetical protein